MRTAYLILLIALTLSIIAPAIPVHAQTPGNTWREYSFPSTGIVAYDADGDGNVEILALPYYMIDNYVQVSSPYEQYEHGMLVDVNSDGVKELVLYNNAGDYLVYSGPKLLKHFYLGTGAPIVDLSGEAIAVGNRVLFNMTVYTFPDAANTQVYPIVADGSLYVVYVKGSLYLEDTEGHKWTVYRDEIEPLGAVLAQGTLYLLGKAPLGGTVFIKYKLNGTAQVWGFTAELKRAIMWIPYDDAFIAEGVSGDIYRVKFNTLVLENTGSVLGYDDRYVYLYQDGKVYVYSPITKTTLTTIILPEPAKPDVFGGHYPYISVSYGKKTYALILKPLPSAYLIMPSTVTVGEKTYYRLDVYEAEEASLTVNGTLIPLEGYITFNQTGTYVFTASMSNGVITVTKTFKIRVVPRPLVLSVRVLGNAVAYQSGKIMIEAIDGLNGSKVESIYCKVFLPGNQTLTAKPWEELSVKFIPPSDNYLNMPMSVKCGDNKYYKETAYSISIPLQPTTAKIKADYLGNGTIEITFISLACPSKTVPGEVNVYLDGKFISHGDVPYVLHGLTPGNHTVTVEFVPRLPVYRPAKYTLHVTYYANVSEVPSELVGKVQIADRVKVINNTVVKTKTVTVPKPIHIKEPVLDTRKAIMFFAIGLAAGFFAGFATHLLTSGRGEKAKTERRRKGGGSDIEEEMEEYEVEVEKT